MTATTTQFCNPLTNNDQEFLNDPYPELKRLREGAPVYWVPDQKYWLISRYDDVQSVLKDNTFGKQIHKWKHNRTSVLAIFFFSLRISKKISCSLGADLSGALAS